MIKTLFTMIKIKLDDITLCLNVVLFTLKAYYKSNDFFNLMLHKVKTADCLWFSRRKLFLPLVDGIHDLTYITTRIESFTFSRSNANMYSRAWTSNVKFRNIWLTFGRMILWVSKVIKKWNHRKLLGIRFTNMINKVFQKIFLCYRISLWLTVPNKKQTSKNVLKKEVFKELISLIYTQAL